jgi:hypothetical protein
MNKQELIEQLESLEASQQCFIHGDDTEIFEKDVEALELAITIIKEWDVDSSDYLRECTECGHLMNEGYVIENGIEYYCSDECLHKHITEEEYQRLYDNGDGDSYWTEWR